MLVHVDDVEILAFLDTVMLVVRKQCLSFWIAMVCRGEKRGVDYNVNVFVGVNKRVKLDKKEWEQKSFNFFTVICTMLPKLRYRAMLGNS